MGTGTAAYPCGCRVVQLMGGGGIVDVAVCLDHASFGSVRRAYGILTRALEEAHEQLPIHPPEPPRAA